MINDFLIDFYSEKTDENISQDKINTVLETYDGDFDSLIVDLYDKYDPGNIDENKIGLIKETYGLTAFDTEPDKVDENKELVAETVIETEPEKDKDFSNYVDRLSTISTTKASEDLNKKWRSEAESYGVDEEDLIERFDKGLFKGSERKAKENYDLTGEINLDLLEVEKPWETNIDLASKSLLSKGEELTEENVKEEAINIYVRNKELDWKESQADEVLEEFESDYGVNRFEDIGSIIETVSQFSIPGLAYKAIKGVRNLLDQELTEKEKEDKEKDYWGFIADQAYKNFGTDQQRKYYDNRNKLYQELEVKEKELDKEYRDKTSDLVSRRQDIDRSIGDINNYEKRFREEDSTLTDEDVKKYNALVAGTNQQISLLEKDIKEFSESAIASNDIETIKNLTLKTYDNLDIASNNISSAIITLGAGLSTLKHELSVPELIKWTGIDIGKDEDLDKVFGKEDSYVKEAVSYWGKFNNKVGDAINAAHEIGTSVKDKNAKLPSIGEVESLSDFGMYALDLASGQLVNTAVTIALPPVGLLALSGGAAGGKMYEMNKEIDGIKNSEGEYIVPPKDINALQYFTTAALYGGVEYATESVSLGILKGVGKNVKKAFELSGSDLTLKNLTNAESWAKFGYNFGKDSFKEAGAEGVVQLTNNLADMYILGNKDVSALDGMTDAMAAGFFMGNMYQTPALVAQVSQSFSSESELAKANALNKQLVELSKQRNEILGKGGDAGAIQSRIDNILDEQMKAMNLVQQRTLDMSPSDRQGMIDQYVEEHGIRAEIDRINENKDYSEDIKKELILEQRNKLIKSKAKRSRIIANSTIIADNKRASDLARDIRIKNNTLGDVEVIIADNNEQGLAKGLEYIDKTDRISDDKKPKLKQKLKEYFSEAEKESKGDNSIINGFAFGDNIEIDGELINLPISFALSKENASVISHELGHMTVFKAFMNNNPNAIKLVDDMVNYISKNYKKLADEVNEIENRYKGRSEAYIAEEKLAAVSDFMRKNDIKSDRTLRNKIFGRFQKINDGKNQIDNGQDVFNMIRSFNESFERGELTGLAETVLSQADLAAVEDVDQKFSKKASDNVQKIYQEQGVGGALDIINEFKPIVNKIVQKRSEAPGFDRQLLTDEIETGKGGILDLITKYKPESGVPLAAFINKYLPVRAIEASRRVLGEVFESDISERVDIVEPVSKVEEVEITEKAKEPVNLRRALDIKEGSDLYNKVKDVVAKTFGTRIPEVTDTKFKKTLQDTYATELTNDVKELMGKPSSDNYKTFLQQYGEQIYDLIPQDILNKSYQDFIVEEKKNLSPTEVDDAISKGLLPSDTPRTAGPSLFTRKPYNQEEFVDFHLAPKKGRPASKQTQLAQTIAKELGKDATLEVLEDPKVFERFTEVQEIEGKKVTKETKPKVAEKIQRKPGVKFSITNPKVVESYQEVAQAKDINKAMSNIGVKDVTITNSNRAQKIVDNLNFIIKGKIGSATFELAKLGNFGRDYEYGKITNGSFAKKSKLLGGKKYFKTIDGDYILSTDKRASLKYDGKDKITNWQPSRGSLFYGKTDPNYIEALKEARKNDSEPINKKLKELKVKKVTVKDRITSSFIEANKSQSDANMNALELMALNLQEAVHKYKMPIEDAALFLTSGYQATSGILKIAAPFKYVSKVFEYATIGKANQKTGKKFREEHNPPASVVGASIILAIKNNQVKDIFPFIKKNYYQTQLSKADDALLDIANLDSTLPEGTSILDNPIKRLAAAGINLNTIINPLTNKDIAEENGYGVPKGFDNMPDLSADQNKAILSEENVDKKVLKNNTKFSKSRENSRVENVENVKNSEVILTEDNMTNEDVINKAATLDEALSIARNPNAPIKKIRVFDFDDTLAQTKSIVFYTKADGTEGQLTAEEFAEKGADLVAEGAVMDFSDFNIVREGKRGPLFDIAKKIEKARGTEDVFVLTARAPESQQAIHEFLKSEGLNIPIENITGLGNSTGAAKANWIVDKAADGYNDFYFADDAYQNVKAVQDALSQLDVKSKVQQAKVKFSKTVNEDFNKIIEQTTGIASEKVYSKAKAKVRGAGKGNKKFFIPYSAEDFMGLIYPLLSKGTLGDSQMAWFKQNLLDPYARAIENLSTDRLQLMQDFKALKKALEVPKNLRKKNDTGFTNEQAVRVYLFNRMGYEVPGLSKTDLQDLIDVVNSDGLLKAFADQLMNLTKGDGYAKPGQSWLAGTITTDLIDVLNTVKRKKYLEQSGFLENADLIFSEENLNKLEAAYGEKYRDAMENILKRMKSGKNRLFSGNRLSNRVLDYINGSIGTIMFLNARSAVLQTISSINFINWSFNNPIKAGKAFANQKQYWKDFIELMNSDYLVDRRNGLKLNISESEIADAASTSRNKAKAAINYILQKGFAPTQIADSFAIASGGATFYRNRINDLIKNEGLTEAEAKEKAMLEFRQVAEISQQSSDPSKISAQQSSDLGRIILAFANTPMQYARIQKRAIQDLINGRGDAKTHVSKIIYYGVVQNIIFNALQQSLFALGFGDDEDDLTGEKLEAYEKEKRDRYYKIANGMLDSQLRGLGVAGATAGVIKNFLLDIYERSGRKRPEYVDAVYKLLQISPPISSKISKVRQAAYQFDSKKRREEVFEKGFSIDNPAYEAGAKVISATTNIPLDRVFNKVNNIEAALAEDTETWQTVAMLAGWPEWQIKPDKKPSELSDKEKAIRKVDKQEENYKAAKGSSDFDILKKLNKEQQIKMLKSLGYGEYKIRKAKTEADRIRLIQLKNVKNK